MSASRIKKVQLLLKEANCYYLIDVDSLEQLVLPEEYLRNCTALICENQRFNLHYEDDKIIKVVPVQS